VVCNDGEAAGVAVGYPRPLEMLSVLRCLAANAHDFARAFDDVLVVSGREAWKICRRFRWTSCR
jgi:hypothetical protein